MLVMFYHYWKDHHYMVMDWNALCNSAATSIVKAIFTFFAIIIFWADNDDRD
jgi:hypothetical protein